MRSAAKILPHFMRYRPHVPPSADAHPEACLDALQPRDLKAGNEHLDSLQFHRLSLARQLISRCAGNLLCGVRRWHLFHLTMKTRRHHAHLLQREHRLRLGPCSLALGIVSIRRKTEADRPRITLLPGGAILRHT